MTATEPPDVERWGPDPAAPGITVQVTHIDGMPLERLLEQVGAVREWLGVPVQVLRADRVASWEHLVMAAEHARRAERDGRMRATDPAVEFLLYAGCDRQIHRAVRALGVPPGAPAEVVVVALGAMAPERLVEALEATGLPAGRTWMPDDPWDVGPAIEAQAWWAERLAATVPAAQADALLAHMALLALERS